MHIKLILNMFSAKAKIRKTFGFPRSRARSHGALPLVYELRIRWDIDEAAAVEILQQISFLHKYLDQCIVVKKYM